MMSFALSSYLILSALFAFSILYMSWLFRSYNKISIYEKVLLVSISLAVGIVAPFLVYKILGKPTATQMTGLPKSIHVLAVEENNNHVYMWLNTESEPIPTSYEIYKLSDKDRKTLTKAEKMLKQGKPVYLERDGDGGEGAGGEGKGKGDGTSEGRGKKNKGKDSIVTDSDEESDGNYRIDNSRVVPPKQGDN